MPTLDVINKSREKVGSLELSDEVFGDAGSSHVVWEVVRHHLAARRAGTVKTKTRGDVSGGGKKPWKQKGTGRARVGSSRNPLWRHGGTTQGPKPRDYDYAISKKKKKVAARRVLSSMVAESRVTVVDELSVSEPRTRAVVGLLAGLGVPETVLLLVNGHDATLERASGNLQRLRIVEPEAVNAYDLLKFRHLVASKDALSRLAEVLAK